MWVLDDGFCGGEVARWLKGVGVLLKEGASQSKHSTYDLSKAITSLNHLNDRTSRNCTSPNFTCPIS